jgi:tetratricopeptide (TPR) repeat protein
LSGGSEWTIGHYGHTFFTCAPVFAAEIRGPGGEPGLRLYEYERCRGLFWHIDFYLPAGSSELIAYTRVANWNHDETPFYWWTNVAMPETPGTRVLAPGRQVIYVDFSGPKAGHGWGELPHLPTLAGDASYSTNFLYASEYFFQLDDAPLPWEAALDEHGQGFFEASTPRMRYRKMFCWGTHTGGKRWQQFLSLPGNDYLEIQGGMAPTQGHGLRMPGQTAWDWVQVFGLFIGDPQQVHQVDYATAAGYVDQALQRRISPASLECLRQDCAALAEKPAAKILQMGSGWGALELARRSVAGQEPAVPPAFVFPASTLSGEQKKWLDLLQFNVFPDADPGELPGEWMIQAEWLRLLERLPQKNWYALLHEGVMRMEGFDPLGAVRAWEESLRLRPSSWACRNLAVAAQTGGQTERSLAYYDKARVLALTVGELPLGLAVECLQALCAACRYAEALRLVESLPEAYRQADRVQILFGRISLELGNLAAVERVLQREYAVIREGETELTDLWADLWLRHEAAQSGIAIDISRRREMLEKYPPPSTIDFRMF